MDEFDDLNSICCIFLMKEVKKADLGED